MMVSVRAQIKGSERMADQNKTGSTYQKQSAQQAKIIGHSYVSQKVKEDAPSSFAPPLKLAVGSALVVTDCVVTGGVFTAFAAVTAIAVKVGESQNNLGPGYYYTPGFQIRAGTPVSVYARRR